MDGFAVFVGRQIDGEIDLLAAKVLQGISWNG
jgi:hypothetical protein